MKPMNFPARKLARQIAVKMGHKGITAKAIIDFPKLSKINGFSESLENARSIRTKKRRTAR